MHKIYLNTLIALKLSEVKKNGKIGKYNYDTRAFNILGGGFGMTVSIRITETEDGWTYIDENARPITEEGNEQPETTKDLESLLAHIDRGGGYPRRIKIGEEFVGVPEAFDVSDFGFLIWSGRFAIIVPDKLESKLRPLQGQKIAILRYSDKDYSVRVV